ncbi:MAG: hypothetical protein HWN66_02830, partial [Candidatus Helarchaeota archaeon]|nr:hypothetical protein [Candidatus Helarchaeota archaeon]
MAEDLFPISGIFREPILIFEAIIVLVCIEFGSVFLYRFFKRDKEKTMILAWAFFFLTFGFMISVFMISDLFTPSNRQFYVNLGYIAMVSGALFFTFNAERELEQKKYIFSVILIILIIFLIVDVFHYCRLAGSITNVCYQYNNLDSRLGLKKKT